MGSHRWRQRTRDSEQRSLGGANTVRKETDSGSTKEQVSLKVGR